MKINIEMKNATGLVDIEEIPTCPMCGQPVEFWQTSCIIGVGEGSFGAYALAHSDCVDE